MPKRSKANNEKVIVALRFGKKDGKVKKGGGTNRTKTATPQKTQNFS